MRLLALADEESKYLWDYYEPEKLRGYDLIVGCGDLSIHYLTFLATVAPIPVVYVHGNHDESYDSRPPTGALCIDDDVFCYKGYRFLGLGGSCRYRSGAWQFTDAISSWTWHGYEGKKTVADVFSLAPKVRLVLNGKTIGEKKTKNARASFKLKYEPGILKAVAIDESGNETGETTLRTGGQEPVIALLPEYRRQARSSLSSII